MGTKTSGAGGKTPWSKIASGKGANPADGFTKGKFSKGKKSSTKGASKKKMMKSKK